MSEHSQKSPQMERQEARFEAAVELKKRIAEFFSRYTSLEKREAELGDLLAAIGKSDVDLESLHFVTEKEDNEKLEAAAQAAATVAYVGVDGSKRAPCNGSYAVVQLGKDGELLAAAANPYGNVNIAYADPDHDHHLGNLIPYALKKAVIEAHLQISDQKSLSFGKNWEYIQSLLPEGMLLFLGSAPIRRDGKVQGVIGVSGSEQNK